MIFLATSRGARGAPWAGGPACEPGGVVTAGRPEVANVPRGWGDRAGGVVAHDEAHSSRGAGRGPKWQTSGEVGGIGPVAWSLTMAGRAPISPSSARSGKPPARLGGSGRSECHSRRLGRRAAGGARPVVPNLRRGRWDRAGHVVAYDGWEGVHPVVRGPKWQTSGEVAGIGPVAWPLATGGKASTPPCAARSGKPPARLLGSGRSAGRSRRWGVRPPCRRLPSMGLHPG